MISLHQPPFSKSHLAEVVAADFGNFQIIVPTEVQTERASVQSLRLAVPKRNYSREGWIIYRDRVVSRLSELEVGHIVAKGCPFKPLKRLGPGVPLAFEAHSRKSLPGVVTAAAVFSCHYPHTATSYCSVFRNLSPVFVRIYPMQNARRQSLLAKAKQLLVEKAQFVAQNREHLQQSPFYREKLNLVNS